MFTHISVDKIKDENNLHNLYYKQLRRKLVNSKYQRENSMFKKNKKTIIGKQSEEF